MEFSTKRRKGSETHIASSEVLQMLTPTRTSPSLMSIVGSQFPTEDCSRRRKNLESVYCCKSRPSAIVTPVPCGNPSSDLHGRGHKRKVGCIDAASELGREKKIEQEYVFGSVIGQGKFGSVRLCRCKASGVEYACKTLPKGNESVHQEVEIMQHLSGHPGVVTLKAVYEDSDCFHLVMELCAGGCLRGHMARQGRYSEHQAANILKELILVIKYCHEMGVVHRDIKPENILLTTSGKMKLADFGLAARFSIGQTFSDVVGSPAYVAPEVLLGDYSHNADIWSAGIVLHALLVGTPPFHGETNEAIFEAIKKVKLDFNSGVWESISGPARDLMSRMLTRDVSARVTADEVLRHPWIVFYTEHTLKTLTTNSSVRNHVQALPHQTNVATSKESDGCMTARGTFDDNSSLELYFDGLDWKTKEHVNSCFVDELVAAISRVRISEPKQIRLFNPTSPIQRECFSNMKANNLCTAF